MNGRRIAPWLALVAALCAVILGQGLLPTRADGMSCTSCSGPLRNASGAGTGATCTQALSAALADAIGNAAGSPSGCIPCSITQTSTLCSDAINWPSLTRSATTSITYRCESCSGGGPPM